MLLVTVTLLVTGTLLVTVMLLVTVTLLVTGTTAQLEKCERTQWDSSLSKHCQNQLADPEVRPLTATSLPRDLLCGANTCAQWLIDQNV